MFSDIESALAAISKRTSTNTFALKLFAQLMEDLGNPQYQLNCLHIAGTNGKGSTANYLRSVLETAGYKTGLFTSPHLINHNDRLRINNIPISDEELLNYINRTIPYWQKYSLTMFEIDTLVAIWHFLDHKVDWAVFEVGLGGRLDATNVVFGKVCVITNIGFDHMEYLGDTLGKIAFEKAGIIKSGSVVFTGVNDEESLSVISRVCADRECPLSVVNSDISSTLDGWKQSYMYKGLNVEVKSVAKYQILNSALAIEALCYMRDSGWITLSDELLLTGIKEAKWLGRFEVVSEVPLVIVDGAHNEHGIKALVESLSTLPRPLVTIFSALKDKETDKMLRMLVDVSNEVIVCEFDFYRAQKAEVLGKGFDVSIIPDFLEAYQEGLLRSEGGTLLITGSLYFISMVRACIISK
ncbi:MAG: bifunctional folylpolyglutamate synthase/dihydrofolate synthase [Firmicutes bacterium HGW-Firmicutes-20]|jgi:dihydrofolate synthase / folylpolyglutamate synthase|nr:MAG: bifunctional folylpolyglutamate synthase/dihydrofolate synthase [Firmicutes bacterium HGW-Firmicutes-20]PKM69276.1 MAG: bifunctional folylpolyglutamate synthase/dihydrofolate synthase [Firmicutes bacterium HGW-Firmicutes-19]